MTAIQCLRQNGPMQANHIARVLGWPLEAVYLELVAAETAGHAWVETKRVRCHPWSIRRWVAL